MKETEEISSPHVLQLKKQEVKKIIHGHASSDIYLDLTNRSIHVIPDELYILPNIEYLYLESNHLEELPDDFFDNLPMLKWLDLRDNQLSYIPPSIGSHRNLKTILLEKNELTHLPLELGNVTTITGLSLRGNPLVIPPPEIVEQGVQVILSYLLDELNAGGDVSDKGDGDEWEYDDDEGYSEDDDDRLSIHSLQSGMQKPDNDVGLHGPTPMPARFHHPRSRNRHPNSLWMEKRLKNASSAGTGIIVNQINLANSNGNGRKSEQQMDRKNWMAKMQQKRQDTIVLDEWRKEAKRLQSLLVSNSKKEKPRRLPPYGIDIAAEPRPVTEQERQIHFDIVEDKVDRVEPKNSKPKDRMDNEVQQRIRQHTSQLRFRKQRKKKESTLQPGRELQRELLDQKMSRDSELEYRFRAFTGDSSSFSSSKKTSSL